jgi:hypothetical protein
LLAALAAPAHRNNALNMVGRLGLAFGVYLLAVNAVLFRGSAANGPRRHGVAGAAVAALAVLEYLGFAPALRFLALFRPSVALVGSEVRASGPLQYPTIASMFLEVSFAFALALMIMAADSRRRASLTAYGVLAWSSRRQSSSPLHEPASLLSDRRWPWSPGFVIDAPASIAAWRSWAFVATVFAVQLLSSRSVEYLRLRLTDGDDGVVVPRRNPRHQFSSS